MRVFVSGYWAKNLGDDLFLKILCERYKDIQFEIDVKEEFSTPFQNIENLQINYLPTSKWRISRVLKKIHILFSRLVSKEEEGFFISFGPYTKITSLPDAYIEIGGSIFMLKENENIKKNNRFRQRMKLAENVKNYFVIGSNFGPYGSKSQVEEYSNFFREISDICFRDEKSKNLFPSMPNVRYESDVILSYENNNDSIKSSKHILISLIDIVYKNDIGTESLVSKALDYENKIIQIVNEYTSRGETVILFSFCDFQGDQKIAERIYKKIDADLRKRVRVESHGEIEKSVQLIKTSKKIIATRFHAMILGWLFRIPTYVISYSKKTEDVITSSYQGQNYIKYTDIEQLSFEKLENSYSIINEEILVELKKSSNKQFSAFDDFIKLGGERN